MDQAEKISHFVSITACTDSEASFYLEAANYDLDRAVAMYCGMYNPLLNGSYEVLAGRQQLDPLNGVLTSSVV